MENPSHTHCQLRTEIPLLQAFRGSLSGNPNAFPFYGPSSRPVFKEQLGGRRSRVGRCAWVGVVPGEGSPGTLRPSLQGSRRDIPTAARTGQPLRPDCARRRNRASLQSRRPHHRERPEQLTAVARQPDGGKGV